jgi:outer membrane protein assembly factor BamB
MSLHFPARKIITLLTLLLVTVWFSFSSVKAQSTPEDAYWQYSAARRLTHVLAADVNRDGVAEFLLAAENGEIDLLNAHNAFREWSYLAGDPVQALNVVNVRDGELSRLEIALATRDELILLDDRGGELWRVALTAVDTPPASIATGENNLADWYARFNPNVRQLLPFDTNGDGRDEILLLFDNGQLHLYDGAGRLLRRLNNHAIAHEDARPQLQTGDLNQDGRLELILGLFNPSKKYSELFLFDQSGSPIWENPFPISGHIIALALPPFGADGDRQIAVGTDRGEIYLFDYNRQEQWWPRTLNKPITALAVAQFPEGPALIAGTEASMVVAYSGDGRRFWTRRLTNDAGRPILSLSAIAYTPEPRHPVLAAVLGPDGINGGNQLVQLLDVDGLDVDTFEAGEGSVPLTQLLDVNGDQRGELLLTRFATVELQGLGLGASETAAGWSYLLDAEPGAVLVVDFDKDGRDELLLGAQNGRLHYLSHDNTLGWLHAPGGAIDHLALLERAGPGETVPTIVVGRNNTTPEPENAEAVQSWVELRQTNGERIWEVELDAPITDLLVNDINKLGDPEIILGTAVGDIIIISATGELVWRTNINRPDETAVPIQKLLVIESPGDEPLIVAATAEALYLTAVGSTLAPHRAAVFETAPLQDIFSLNQPGSELANRLLALTDKVQGLNWRGLPLPAWPPLLSGLPMMALPADDPVQEIFASNTAESFLIATDNNELLRLTIQDNRPETVWTLNDLPDATALYWGDLDGNRLAELAVGNRAGTVSLYTNVPPQPQFLDELNLTSGVFALTALRTGTDNRADLLIVTENGEVQLFNAQENRPPLLTNPTTEVSRGQYSFNLSVMDAEGDEVRVWLEIQEPETGEWVAYREATLDNGNGPLFWNVADPPAAADGVHYRYQYTDGTHTGIIYPPVGPQPLIMPSFGDYTPASLLLASLVGGLALFLLARQVQSPAMRTRRFYWRLQRHPAETLIRLENRYLSTNGSLDFLLALSGIARQRGDELVSGLADGLFLLADRPQAGLPLIVGALEKGNQSEPRWQAIDRWLLLFKTGRELLAAPTLTELSLEWPQLQGALETLDKWGYWSPALYALLPSLTTIRDSERVNRPGDRLVYLHEAGQQLTAVLQDLLDYDTAIEKPLALAVARRWAGLISAETAELEGRAELVLSLKTRRIVPDVPTAVTFEVANNGRAPAENIIAVLNDDLAYASNGLPEIISFIPPGQTRTITFDIRPLVADRFRVGLTVTFDDRNQPDRTVAFGDQIHVLPPQRDFTPIPNPYRPGTPLRQKSGVFYGREWLFHFIADNAGNWTQRNVLILIGQRRTGKTSALLNLEHHLPGHLLPVYIDCQSLGVTPGMAALFHDWAWLIADVLATRGVELPVPEMAAWEADPTGQFQRHFLPAARAALPPETTLLLVFDEFEVFEHLVDDGILPPTFFNFVRHLMQHSEGLSFVFVGTRRLEEMSADYWSVMFNIALYQRITYLRDEPALRLITEPVAPYLVYDDLALDKILRVTAGHPYFLQLVCYTLVQQANKQQKGYVTISDVNAALDEMLTLGEVHFAYLWQGSSYTEQAILTAVSHMPERPHPFRPEEFIQFLEPYGIHLHPKEVTAALNTLVEREIMREVRDGATAQYELRLGLVGLWAAQHKSLSKLHATPANGAGQNGKQRVKQVASGK